MSKVLTYTVRYEPFVRGFLLAEVMRWDGLGSRLVHHSPLCECYACCSATVLGVLAWGLPADDGDDVSRRIRREMGIVPDGHTPTGNTRWDRIQRQASWVK